MKPCLPVLATLALLAACAAAMSEEKSWSFVTSVGGLAWDRPIHEDDGWKLPVRADVSGLQAITNAPTTMNSGLVCDKTRARVDGRDIYIVIVTTIPHGNATSACPAANLGVLEPGQYNVLYGSRGREGVKLGTVDVAL